MQERILILAHPFVEVEALAIQELFERRGLQRQVDWSVLQGVFLVDVLDSPQQFHQLALNGQLMISVYVSAKEGVQGRVAQLILHNDADPRLEEVELFVPNAPNAICNEDLGRFKIKFEARPEKQEDQQIGFCGEVAKDARKVRGVHLSRKKQRLRVGKLMQRLCVSFAQVVDDGSLVILDGLDENRRGVD